MTVSTAMVGNYLITSMPSDLEGMGFRIGGVIRIISTNWLGITVANEQCRWGMSHAKGNLIRIVPCQ